MAEKLARGLEFGIKLNKNITTDVSDEKIWGQVMCFLHLGLCVLVVRLILYYHDKMERLEGENFILLYWCCITWDYVRFGWT